jgi:hypothetical protein
MTIHYYNHLHHHRVQKPPSLPVWSGVGIESAVMGSIITTEFMN